MDNSSMFETLLDLPLFRGVSKDRITDIVGKVKFHFLKYMPGEDIILPGNKCTHLKFILSGEVRLTIGAASGRLRVEQTVSGPDMIQPQYLFGRATSYLCSAEALTQVSLLQIEKADYLKILTMDPVFLLNYLNFLSMKAQMSVEGILNMPEGGLEERIAYWIVTLTQANAKGIKLQARGENLWDVLGTDAEAYHTCLKKMKADGLISYDDKRIAVTDRKVMLGKILR